MREQDTEINVELDPALTPMQAAGGAGFLPPVVVPVAGAVHAIDGMLGPDITFATGAPVNGIAVAKSSVGNVTTFSITGPGTMAQRNAVAAIALLAQTTSNPPTQAEVQAIANKIDELITAQKAANHMLP